MEKTKTPIQPAAAFLKILFLMYMVTFVLLLALAFVLFKMDPGETVFRIWLIAVYVISGLLGGFLMGKKVKNRRFLWGLMVGVVYFAILFAVSVILKRGIGDDIMHLLMTFVLCAASGTVGGMIS